MLALILTTTQEAWHHHTLPTHPRLIALYSAILLETLEKMGPVTEEAMRVLLPFLLRVVKSKKAEGEYKLASYMALGKMASCTSFAPHMVATLLLALVEGLDMHTQTHTHTGGEENSALAKGLAVVVAVMHSQGLSRFPCVYTALISCPFLVSYTHTHTHTHTSTHHPSPREGSPHRRVAPHPCPARSGGGRDQDRAFYTHTHTHTHTHTREREGVLMSFLSVLRPCVCVSKSLPGLIFLLAQAGVALSEGEGEEEEKERRECVCVCLKEIAKKEKAAYEVALMHARTWQEAGKGHAHAHTHAHTHTQAENTHNKKVLAFLVEAACV